MFLSHFTEIYIDFPYIFILQIMFHFSSMFWLTFIWLTSSSLFVPNYLYKCYGNYQFKDGKCVPCQSGSVALNGRCKKLDLSFKYGAVGRQQLKDYNCEPKRFFFGVCLKCKEGFYLDQNSKCQQISKCDYFAQKLKTCLNKTQYINYIAQLKKEKEESYVLSEEQQIQSIRTSYQYQATALNSLTSDVSPLILTSQAKNTINQNKKQLLPFKIHQQLKLQNVRNSSTSKCDYKLDKECLTCQNSYIYNKLLLSCIKVSNNLQSQPEITNSNDGKCKLWGKISQQNIYGCKKCKQGFIISAINKKCVPQSIGCQSTNEIGECNKCLESYRLVDGNCKK